MGYGKRGGVGGVGIVSSELALSLPGPIMKTMQRVPAQSY